MSSPSPAVGREIFRSFGRRVILPVAAIVAGAMAVVVAFLVFTARQQDAIAVDASTRLARTALAVKQHEIGRNLKDYAGWQDAYQNLHVQLNTEWAAADGNVGANVYHSLGYEMAFVVDSADRTVYAVLEGEPQTADALCLDLRWPPTADRGGTSDAGRGAGARGRPAARGR